MRSREWDPGWRQWGACHTATYGPQTRSSERACERAWDLVHGIRYGNNHGACHRASYASQTRSSERACDGARDPLHGIWYGAKHGAGNRGT